jgi:hypothetical protein
MLIEVAVTHRQGVFESTACPEVGRSFTADSLPALRRKITVATLGRRRNGTDLQVAFLLDSAARAARAEQQAAAEVEISSC